MSSENHVSGDGPAQPDIAIIGTSSTVVEREIGRSLEELIFDTSRATLASAGLTIDDIDSVVLSGNDEIDGRVISIMASSGPSGSVGRDTTMIASAGDHALIYGYLRLLAGQGKKVLVLGWAKPSESVSPDHAELVEAEPFLLRQVGMNHTVAAALLASALRKPGDALPEGPLVAWPLSRQELPARGDSVHGVVLAIDGAFPDGSELAWIKATGWATATYELGDRTLGDFDSLRAALGQVAKRSPEHGPSSWDAVEIGASSEPAVAAVARSLDASTDLVVNASGSLSQHPTSPHVAGLSRMVAAIRAVTKGAGTVAGIGFHGFAGQGATVVVFGSEKGAAS